MEIKAAGAVFFQISTMHKVKREKNAHFYFLPNSSRALFQTIFISTFLKINSQAFGFISFNQVLHQLTLDGNWKISVHGWNFSVRFGSRERHSKLKNRDGHPIETDTERRDSCSLTFL